MPNLVTYDQIARMSGGALKADSLRMIASRGQMPDRAHPSYPVWQESDIKHWLRGRDIEPVDLSDE